MSDLNEGVPVKPGSGLWGLFSEFSEVPKPQNALEMCPFFWAGRNTRFAFSGSPQSDVFRDPVVLRFARPRRRIASNQRATPAVRVGKIDAIMLV